MFLWLYDLDESLWCHFDLQMESIWTIYVHECILTVIAFWKALVAWHLFFTLTSANITKITTPWCCTVMIRLAARLTLASNAPQVPLLLFGASFVVRAVHCLNDSIVWFWVNFFVPWLWEVFHSIIHNDLSLLHAILVLSQTVCCVVIISSLFISPVELNSISSLQSYSYLVFSVFVFILSHRTKLPKLRHTYCNRDHTFYVIVIL